MQGQKKINIKEERVPKFTERSGCYEVINDDSSIKIVLRYITVMDGSMESGFYSTKMWIKEDNGWIEVSNTENYSTKEEFIKDMKSWEDFTQAIRDYEEYKFNI